MCEPYNGWSNRETWATMLHIDNTLGEHWLIDVLESFESDGNFRVWRLGDYIEQCFTDAVDEMWSDVESSNHVFRMVTSDIGSLYRVNWQEIAEHIAGENYYRNYLNLDPVSEVL
jgi:hypothetical protein